MRKNKLLALLLSVALTFSLAVPALAEEETVTPYAIPADVSGKLVVIHTNDTHGHDVAEEGKTVGTAGVAALKKDFEEAGATVLLVSAGDFSQGTTLVSLDKGASAIDFMNAAGYDVAAPGNHEFDYKMEALKANVEKAEFPILAANIVYTETKEPLFGDNVTFDTAIGKVGVFGLDTPETMTKAHPDNVQGLTFYQDEELVACAQAQVDELKASGCEFIIALGHLGVDPESEPNRSSDIFAKVTGVDLVVDGHSHTTMAGDAAVTVGDTLIVSTGEYLANVGVVITDGETTTSTLVTAAEYTKVDEAVAKIVNDKAAEIAAELDKVFATTEVELNGERDPGNRTMETNLGDFAADAILWSAKQNMGEDNVDAALTNGGGIRATIPAGDITMNTMKTVFPFGNEVATINLTGAELLEALEAATCSTPTAIGAFPQVAGIAFVITTGTEYVNGEQYPDSTYFAPANPGSRVEILSVGGEAWDAEATYTIATNDFTAAGGDTYGVFLGKSVYKTGVPLEDALVNYTREVLGNNITAEKYGTTAGRIVIIPTDVKADDWFYDAVVFNFTLGTMKGTDKGFEAANTVTVATVYQTLYNMEEQPTEGIEKAAFNDIEGKWYENAAHWAAFTGLAEGDAEGNFNGDAVITRSQIATILADYCALGGLTVEGGMAVKEAPDYDQVPEADLAGVDFCYEAGIMTGNENGELMPAGEVTRAEFAQILENLTTFIIANLVTEAA